MVSQTITPQNSAEKLIWYALIFCYPFYFLGALYLVGPVVGWSLLFLLLINFITSQQLTDSNLKFSSIHFCWVVGMLLMLLALVVGHLNFNLSNIQLIKSTVGWAKGWALLAIFILCGALPVRPCLIIRACMKICQHTLLLMPLFIGAWLLGLPQTLYVSPLQVIGGPGPEFFALSLYEIDPGSGLPRWRLFTPWAPALGMLANIFLVFAFEEKSTYWRRIGFTAAVCMILMSQSRLALLFMLFILAFKFQLKFLGGYRLMFFLSIFSLIFTLFSEPIVQTLENSVDAIKSARADSTRVRSILARIAIDRWWNEAPIWGHGIVERGPHLVEYMPIGSHHTWYGLLFIKGLIGLLALLLPMLISVGAILTAMKVSRLAPTALLLLLLLIAYTLGENLEILAYLFWPALIIIGVVHKEGRNQQKTSADLP